MSAVGGTTLKTPVANEPRDRVFNITRRPVAVRVETPPPSDFSASEDEIDASDVEYGIIASSRPRVGRPDYTFHPKFIRPGLFNLFVDPRNTRITYIFVGIPGKYERPPLGPSEKAQKYYVITKGLYVGIFFNW